MIIYNLHQAWAAPTRSLRLIQVWPQSSPWWPPCRLAFIVPACQLGWEEMEILRGNLRGNNSEWCQPGRKPHNQCHPDDDHRHFRHQHLHHHGHQVGKLVAFLSSFVRDNAVEPEVSSVSLWSNFHVSFGIAKSTTDPNKNSLNTNTKVLSFFSFWF